MFENLTIKTAGELLRNKEVSALELTEAYLKRAGEKNPALNAYLEITGSEAMAAAAEADRLISTNETSPLTGIPIAVKDNILIKNVHATAGSKILQNYT